jgi:APA family basic amino acid/polyamine antiporter
MQGQIPAAAAADKLLPSIFKIENEAGAPVFSLVISSVLVSLLLMMNFSRSLGDTYQFAILLTAMVVLIPYSFSAVAFVIMGAKEKRWTSWKLIVATIAFLYSVWAVAGSGQEAVYWGFILLLIGVPIFGWSRMRG